MASSAVNILEQFGPRHRPTMLTLFDGSCSLQWLIGKVLFWAWCSALVWVRVRTRVGFQTLIAFYYPDG